MNNLKLQNKIFLILLLPLITIVILSFNSIYDKYEKNSKMNESLAYLNFLGKVSTLSHDLQKEREIATLFLDSYGKSHIDDFQIQVKKSDESIDNLNSILEKSNFPKSDELNNKLSKYIEDIKKIKEIREKNQNLLINKQELINGYTSQIVDLTYFIDELITYSNVGNLSKYSQSYIAFNQLIENSFNEKEYFRNILNSGNILGENYNNFLNSISKQNLYLQIINDNIFKEDSDKFKNLLISKDFQDIENVRKTIILKSQKDNFILKIKELSGYGGLIHLYKDYLESKDEKLVNKIQSKHSSLLKMIKYYEKFEGTTNEEKILLKDIRDTFDLIISNVSDISEGNHSISKEKIDNNNAISAIDKLSNSIYGIDENWKEKSINKINLLINFEKNLKV